MNITDIYKCMLSCSVEHVDLVIEASRLLFSCLSSIPLPLVHLLHMNHQLWCFDSCLARV